jgi:hypothetical protein
MGASASPPGPSSAPSGTSSPDAGVSGGSGEPRDAGVPLLGGVPSLFRGRHAAPRPLPPRVSALVPALAQELDIVKDDDAGEGVAVG